MKRFFIVGCLFMFTLSAYSQSYGSTLGLRLGNDKIKRTAGITFQQRLAKKVTLEAILQSDFKQNTTAHTMVAMHQGILTRRLNFYVGTGLSVGKEESEEKDPQTQQIITTIGNSTVGVDLVTGLELTLVGYTVTLDYKPNFNMAGRNPWFVGQTGVSVRAVIVKGTAYNKKQRKKAREKRKNDREDKVWMEWGKNLKGDK